MGLEVRWGAGGREKMVWEQGCYWQRQDIRVELFVSYEIQRTIALGEGYAGWPKHLHTVLTPQSYT